MDDWKKIKKAQAYINRMKLAERQGFAQKTLWAILDQKPFPPYDNVKLTRTMTPAAQYKQADAIRRKLISILYPLEVTA
jgi:hypothetical protein